MAIEFELKIEEVIKVVSVPATDDNNYENDLSDVIIKINYTYKGEKSGHTYKWPGELNMPNPSASDDFIAIEDITEDIVLGWINSIGNLTQLKTFIESALDEQINPPSMPVYFDWLPDPFPVSVEAASEDSGGE